MGGKFSLAQMRIMLILGAVLLLLLTYFLVFQRNMDAAATYDTKTQKANSEIGRLEALQTQVTDLEIFNSRYEEQMMDYSKSFPVKLTQEKAIYMVYRMMIQSGVEVQSMTLGNQVPFYYKGELLTSASKQEQAQKEYDKEPMSELIVKDSMEEMVGSMSVSSVNITGTTKQIYKALDWITESKEKLSIGDVDLQFDSTTGKLTGTLGVNFYCMLGNGVPYKAPDISSFSFGVDNVFGSFK